VPPDVSVGRYGVPGLGQCALAEARGSVVVQFSGSFAGNQDHDIIMGMFLSTEWYHQRLSVDGIGDCWRSRVGAPRCCTRSRCARDPAVRLYRAYTRTLSLRWFLAIHVPVLLIFLARFESHLSYAFIPFTVAAFAAAQIVGSRAGRWWIKRRQVVPIAEEGNVPPPPIA